jgi:hypothetical protein
MLMPTMRRIFALSLLALAAVAPVNYVQAKTRTTLSIDVNHDLDRRQLRGHILTKLDGKTVLSKKTISDADFEQLTRDAKAFVDSKMKSHERDPELGKDGEGKSHVDITVNLNGKKKTVDFESNVEPGSVKNAPTPFKAIAEKLRALAP